MKTRECFHSRVFFLLSHQTRYGIQSHATQTTRSAFVRAANVCPAMIGTVIASCTAVLELGLDRSITRTLARGETLSSYSILAASESGLIHRQPGTATK